MAAYPDGLPLPQVAEYSVATVRGLGAVRFERGNTRQRRMVRRDRNVFSLAFVFTTAELWTWQSWANQYGYDWHTMSLESAYSGLSVTGASLIPHTVRYISDIAFQTIAAGIVRVSVQAEMDVTTIPQGILAPSGNWYVAGSPSSPATDKILAGTPAAPSTDTIIAGTPALPAA